jgi:alpha-glucosidase
MSDLKWWQKAVFYQVYPRSFADSNGDGIGDLPGLIERLDYLQDLGVDGLWLSPHYPSPQVDCGYDVADYTGVAPEYGTLNDFQRFLDGAHRRGMRLILDLVLNHTSDQHTWFLESRLSRDNPKRDWYIWRDGKGDGPPNNWNSTFGGSAWELDPLTGQYYYHFFFKEQPDLNWRNPEVRRAVYNEMRFWFDLGVDGFRIDAIGTLFEDPRLADHKAPYTLAELHRMTHYFAGTDEERRNHSKYWHAMFSKQVDQPEMLTVLRELRQVADEYGDRVLVGEADRIEYHGNGQDMLHLVFNFHLMRTELPTPAFVRQNQRQRLRALQRVQGWPGNTFGNHDSPRLVSRYGDGEHDAQIARLLPALLLTLRGTPFLYNGEEIGMHDLMLSDFSQLRDSSALWWYRVETEELGTSPGEAVRRAARYGRDKCRTPMQWANLPNGGFSPAGVQPWLPVNPDYAQGVNVAEQLADPESLLNFYRRLLRLRKQNPALVEGDYKELLPQSQEALVFLRRSQAQTCLVALNFTDRLLSLPLQGFARRKHRLLYSSRERAESMGSLEPLELGPFEIFLADIS